MSLYLFFSDQYLSDLKKMIEQLYAHFRNSSGVCTDSREIKPDCLFFALKGASFNGNHFAAKALDDGAQLAIVDEEDYATDNRYLLVNNTLTCLQQLAAYHRQQLNIPVIAITGSNGKTTTKELTQAVMSRKFKSYATPGNFNNHIGVPLSLLNIEPGTEIAIIEMGANHIGEIASLCQIAQPDYGLITNIGKAHLEGFGSFKGVKQAKGELYSYLKQNNGKIFFNSDNQILIEMLDRQEAISYGQNREAACQGYILKDQPLLSIALKQDETIYRIDTQLVGGYNLENILAAACIGRYFGICNQEIKTAIESYRPGNKRSQCLTTDRYTLILDNYNANPSSMKAALGNFAAMPATNKVLILGDMFELGQEAPVEHQVVVNQVLRIKNLTRVYFVGPEFCACTSRENRTEQYCFKNTDSFLNALKADPPAARSTILIKGSRGMQLEKCLQILTAQHEQ